jgi:hypothetical protein
MLSAAFRTLAAAGAFAATGEMPFSVSELEMVADCSYLCLRGYLHIR